VRLTARRPALSSLRTRAQAGVKLAAGAAAATQLTAALPALAVIEERMGGEGAGAYGRLPLGINDPILGFILAGVVVTVWGLYLTTGGNAGYEEEDSGLDL